MFRGVVDASSATGRILGNVVAAFTKCHRLRKTTAKEEVARVSYFALFC